MASSTIQLELSAGWWTRFGLRQARCLLTSHLLARSQHPSVIAGIQAGSVGKFNPAVCHSFRPRKTRRNFFVISEASGHVNVTYRSSPTLSAPCPKLWPLLQCGAWQVPGLFCCLESGAWVCQFQGLQLPEFYTSIIDHSVIKFNGNAKQAAA